MYENPLSKMAVCKSSSQVKGAASDPFWCSSPDESLRPSWLVSSSERQREQMRECSIGINFCSRVLAAFQAQ